MIGFPVLLGLDGRPIVMQKITHPAIYLDTWALRLFAEGEPALGQRFRAALLRAGGYLMLLHMSANNQEYTIQPLCRQIRPSALAVKTRGGLVR